MNNVTLLRIKIEQLKQVINSQSLTFELHCFIYIAKRLISIPIFDIFHFRSQSEEGNQSNV